MTKHWLIKLKFKHVLTHIVIIVVLITCGKIVHYVKMFIKFHNGYFFHKIVLSLFPSVFFPAHFHLSPMCLVEKKSANAFYLHKIFTTFRNDSNFQHKIVTHYSITRPKKNGAQRTVMHGHKMMHNKIVAFKIDNTHSLHYILRCVLLAYALRMLFFFLSFVWG